MDKLDWMTTMKLAHTIAELPPTRFDTEVPRLRELLGVVSVTYTRGEWNEDLPEGEDYLEVLTIPDLFVKDWDTPCAKEYLPANLLKTVGSWEEAWMRLIAMAMDAATSPYWGRDNDMSALLGYGSDMTDFGVLYHRYDEGAVEFKLVQYNTVYLCEESSLTPYQLLQYVMERICWHAYL